MPIGREMLLEKGVTAVPKKPRRKLLPEERTNIRQDFMDNMNVPALAKKYGRARSHIETITSDIKQSKHHGKKSSVTMDAVSTPVIPHSAVAADERKRLNDLCKEFRTKAKKILVKSKVRSVQICLDKERNVVEAARVRTLRFSE